MSMTEERIQQHRDAWLIERQTLGPFTLHLPSEITGKTERHDYLGPGVSVSGWHHSNTSGNCIQSIKGELLPMDAAIHLAREFDVVTVVKSATSHTEAGFTSLAEAIRYFYEMLDRRMADAVQDALRRVSHLQRAADEIKVMVQR